MNTIKDLAGVLRLASLRVACGLSVAILIVFVLESVDSSGIDWEKRHDAQATDARHPRNALDLSEWPSLASIDAETASRMAAITLTMFQPERISLKATEQLFAAAKHARLGLGLTAPIKSGATGQGPGQDPKPPGTHNYLSDTHYETTDIHYYTSVTHSEPSVTHYTNSNTHYPGSDLHYESTDVHYYTSDTKFQNSDIHYVTSVTHRTTSDNHYEGSTTHFTTSDTHEEDSTNHTQSSSFHGPVSGMHYGNSFDHGVDSQLHNGLSSTHSGPSSYHNEVSETTGDWLCSGPVPPILVKTIQPWILINANDGLEGPIIIQEPAGNVQYPLSNQTEVGKLHFVVEYVVDFSLPVCDEPPSQPAPPIATVPQQCPSAFDSYATLNVRVKDPDDLSSYEVDPSANDNLDNSRRRGNIIVSEPYFEHSKGIPEIDAHDNKVAAHIMPILVGTTNSMYPYNQSNGIHAYVYRVEFDLEATSRYQGDNYSVEFSLNSGYLDWDLECNWVVPEFRDSYPSGYVDPYASKPYDITAEAGPFTAWDKMQARPVVSALWAADLAEDVPAGSTQAVIYQLDGTTSEFAVGSLVKILDALDPVGEEVQITSVQPYPYGMTGQMRQQLITFDPPVTKTFKFGYPLDPQQPIAGGRGGCVVWFDPNAPLGDNYTMATIDLSLVEAAFEDYYAEFEVSSEPVVQVPGVFNLFPSLGDFGSWNLTQASSALRSRMSMWVPGYQLQFPAPGSVFFAVAGSRFSDVSGVPPPYKFRAGLADFSGASRTAMVACRNFEVLLPPPYDKSIARSETTAHESVHMMTVLDCSHSVSIDGTSWCLMNNNTLIDHPDQSDGIVKSGYLIGMPLGEASPDFGVGRCEPTW